MEDQKILGSDEVKKAIASKSFNYLRRMYKSLESADIAESFLDLEIDEKSAAVRLIEKARKAEVFSYLPTDDQRSILEKLPEDLATFILNEMEPADRTQLLEELPIELSAKFILRLDPEERKIARKLLGYPEDSIGRIMSPECFSIPAGMTIAQAIEFIRWNASRYPEDSLAQIYVVNDEGCYLGDTSLGALFVADDTTQKVETIIGSSYVTLSAFDDESAAVDMFRKYDKSSIAAIDKDGRLVGMVTAEDVFDIAEEEATEDLQQFGGTGVLEDGYFETPFLILLRKRAGWLAVLFFGGLVSSKTLRGFQDAITAFPILAVFLTMIVSSGGNSGSQAASLVIRGIVIREISPGDWLRVLARELLTGMGLGVVLGVMGFAFASIWGLEAKVAYIVGFSLVGVVTFGAVLGSMLPFILKRCGIDPAISSSPLIASLADLFGILIFFNIAQLFLGSLY
jgi:magnesium transporter